MNTNDLDTSSSVSRQHYIDTGRYLAADEVAADAVCDACGGTGYLLDQSYGNADVPEDWTPVQACDQYRCGQVTDEEAARNAATCLNHIDARVFYAWFPGGLDDDDNDLPGDWAIGPNQ